MHRLFWVFLCLVGGSIIFANQPAYSNNNSILPGCYTRRAETDSCDCGPQQHGSYTHLVWNLGAHGPLIAQQADVACIVNGTATCTENDTIDDGCDCDFDLDGYVNVNCGGNDCDDGDNSRHPGATELCYNGIDDCDGYTDTYDANCGDCWFVSGAVGPVRENEFPLDEGCPPGSYNNGDGCCISTTPIVIDILGNGYSLSGFNDPVAYNVPPFQDQKSAPIRYVAAGDLLSLFPIN